MTEAPTAVAVESGSLGVEQLAFSRFVRRRQCLTADREAIAWADQHLSGNAELAPVEQLEIYREQFWLRHTQSLIEDFPGVGGIVGQRAWERLSEEYLVAHPPSSFTLRNLGERLPDFIARHADWLEERELVYDMAALEWAYVEVFDADIPRALSLEALARYAGDLENATFLLAPSLRLLAVRYPVVELRKRIVESADAPVAIPAREVAHLVIHRRDLATLHERLEPEAFTLLSALAQGQTLARACEAACAPGPDAVDRVAKRVGDWLAEWVKSKWIVGIGDTPDSDARERAQSQEEPKKFG